jgi:rubrerythrin
MISHNTPQEYPVAQNRYHLADASMRRFAQPASSARQSRQPRQTRQPRHWVCSGCGTAHAGMFPEECLNCGATALEFEYTSPADQPAAS